MLYKVYLRIVTAAILGGISAWLLVLFPFGAVGLRGARAVRIAAGAVTVVVFLLALALLDV